MTEFLMPSLGADMESGTLISWEKNPGDKLKRGDVIAVVETQKGAIEIEVFEDGVLGTCIASIGEGVPVGTPIAEVRYTSEQDATTGESPPLQPENSTSEVLEVSSEPVEPRVPVDSYAKTEPEDSRTVSARIKITPAARKLANDHGLDLQIIDGTGPQREIVLADVHSTVQKTPDVAISPQASENQVATGMRQAIAASMARSKREIPHYYLSQTVDLTTANAFVTNFNADLAPEERLLSGALFMKALALALKRYPEFNGFFTDGQFQAVESAHIGMAINIRGGGLVAPAIHNVQDLDLGTLMAKMLDLVARVRAGRFRSAELNEPTITLSNLGERSVETLYGVIYPPQVAIVGFGTPTISPWVVDGKIEARTIIKITLAADHRVSDGHRGALFLNAIRKWLNKPEKL